MSVNNNPLPAKVTASGDITSSTAIGGSIFLDKDGTYSAIAQFQIVRGNVTTIEPYGVPSGTWVRSDATQLSLMPKTGSETNVRALISGNTLTVISQGLAYGYTRQ